MESGRVVSTHHYWVQTFLEGGGSDAADLMGFRSCPQVPAFPTPGKGIAVSAAFMSSPNLECLGIFEL